MKADFSGWATKVNLKCTDGRTIMPGAFEHQNTIQVPLVWQHGHTNPENLLGHAILESRPEGVYAYGFFNETDNAQHIKKALAHKDINALSIWANQLVERGKKVFHGAIKEVSLVLSGANPGALIENFSIAHGDGDFTLLDDEVVIHTGLELEHSDMPDELLNAVSDTSDDSAEDDSDASDDSTDDDSDTSDDSASDDSDTSDDSTSDDSDTSDDSISDDSDAGDVQHADNSGEDDETIQDVIDAMTDKQRDVVAYLIQEAAVSVEHSDINDGTNDADTGEEGKDSMGHRNVFESTNEDEGGDTQVLSHDDMSAIIGGIERFGSLKASIEDYGMQHGITNIGSLFPDAKAVTAVPEFLKRRTEWVDVFLSNVTKTPFSRIKTLSADLTYEDARAKGYIKGTMKKEEFFPIATRTTTPTTVYKKQKLDRDDIIDITDFDVVVWLKAEMRIMLDEEIARAMLIGDGRDVSHEDKINEQNIRPIAKDNDLFATTVNVNILDANSSVSEISDGIILARKHLRGSGLPSFFTTETIISLFMLLKDTTGRRIYRSLDELASELRVKEIVAVEAMEEDATLIGVIVNPVDYTLGADRGGQVSMFDDFNIDYNKFQYLIETRMSGALTKLKSALVIRSVAADVTVVTPTIPTFNSDTGVVTIPSKTGVVYKNEAGDTLTAGAQSAIAAGATINIYAFASSSSYALANNAEDVWDFTREAS